MSAEHNVVSLLSQAKPVVRQNETLKQTYQFKFTQYEMVMLNFIMANTFGMQVDCIDISAVAIADQTGIDPSHVRKALKSLHQNQVIERVEKTIYINLNFDEWTAEKRAESARNENRRNLPVNKQNGRNLPEKRAESAPNTSISNISSSLRSEDTSQAKESEKPASKKKTKIKFSDDDMKVAEYIHRKLKNFNPEMSQPNLNTWANDVRLMIERDGRTHKRVCEVFQWAHADGFWQDKILSPSKLRQKFDTLTARMNNGGTTYGTNQNQRHAAKLTSAQKQERDRKRIEQLRREEAGAASQEDDSSWEGVPPYLL